MNTIELVLILGSLGASTTAFVWLAIKLGDRSASDTKAVHGQLEQQAKEDVEHIFNDEFRQELRNRGRLHFEKIIGENAMFLQQDLRLTTSQLNEYMKAEITSKLREEFDKYEQSIMDAKQLAIDSISKTQEAIEQQRQAMSQQLSREVAVERARIIKHFEQNMVEIINHYVLAAIGDQTDLNDQLDFILRELEANKEAIIKDLSSDGQ